MKKIILSISLAVVATGAIPSNASAQRYDTRVDVARLADEGRDHRGDRDDWREGRGGRLASEIEQLRRDVRRVGWEIRRSSGGGRRIRYEFDRVAQKTDRVSDRFRQGGGDRRELWRRVQELRADLVQIQRRLRERLH